MRLNFLIVFLANVLLFCSAGKVPAKSEGCVSEENCGTICEYDGHKMFPGMNKTLHRVNSCIEMVCSEDFYIHFEK